MNKRALSFLGIMSMVFLSCETFHSEIEPASYLYVNQFTVDNDSSILPMWQIKSTKITDVWLYLDESQFQGAYELPAIIPIAAKGNHKISLRAGIKNAGITTDRRIYPYYAEYEISNFNLIPNYVDTITPITKYDLGNSGIEAAWFENFESLFSSWTNHPNSDTVVKFVTDENVFDGKFSGGIFLDDDDYFFEMISDKLTKLPRNGIPIYLELNYKTNHKFIVGLYASNKSEQIPVYTITEKEDWNKIYLDLTDYVNYNSDANDFNIFIGISKSTGEGPVKMYIDNIKLIYFK